MPANSTATWTCTAFISETTTNVATFSFVESYSSVLGNITYNNIGEGVASITVERTLPPGALSCNTLWYSSDEYDDFAFNGELGTILPDGTTTTIADYQNQTGSSSLEGSAAMAMDPSDPAKIYYIPREDLGESSNTFGGLYVYDAVLGTSAIVSSNANTPDAVRLGMDPNGLVWTVIGGVAWSFDVPTSLS